MTQIELLNLLRCQDLINERNKVRRFFDLVSDIDKLRSISQEHFCLLYHKLTQLQRRAFDATAKLDITFNQMRAAKNLIRDMQYEVGSRLIDLTDNKHFEVVAEGLLFIVSSNPIRINDIRPGLCAKRLRQLADDNGCDPDGTFVQVWDNDMHKTFPRITELYLLRDPTDNSEPHILPIKQPKPLNYVPAELLVNVRERDTVYYCERLYLDYRNFPHICQANMSEAFKRSLRVDFTVMINWDLGVSQISSPYAIYGQFEDVFQAVIGMVPDTND